MTRHYFEVQHYTLAAGWVNTWSDEDGKPIRFPSRAAAVRELRAYFADLRRDAEAGNIQAYGHAEFRVSRH